jgi:hypothetical protein
MDNIYLEDYGLKHKGLYRNKETKSLYFIIDIGNAPDGQIMVIYRSYEELGPIFIREVNEFKEKFTHVNKP